MFHYDTYTYQQFEKVLIVLDCSIFVFSLMFERGKKFYCMNLMKFTVAMQHIACCMIKIIKTKKPQIMRCSKNLFSLNLINNVTPYSS